MSRCEKLSANRTAIAEDEAVMGVVVVVVNGWVWVLVMFILKIKNPAPFGNRAEKIGFVYFLSHCSPSNHRMERVRCPATATLATTAKATAFERAGKAHSTSKKPVWLAVNTLETILGRFTLSITVVPPETRGAF